MQNITVRHRYGILSRNVAYLIILHHAIRLTALMPYRVRNLLDLLPFGLHVGSVVFFSISLFVSLE
jgi:hypothetical protein